MTANFITDKFIYQLDIEDDIMITISEFTHIERAEFRQVLTDGIVKAVKNIIDNPHFKGV